MPIDLTVGSYFTKGIDRAYPDKWAKLDRVRTSAERREAAGEEAVEEEGAMADPQSRSQDGLEAVSPGDDASRKIAVAATIG